MDEGTHYPWMDLGEASLDARQAALEARREELLAAASSGETTDCVKREWVELLVERDRVLKHRLATENETLLHQHMVSLLQLLVTIGQFDHSSTPPSLRSALHTLYSQLSTHLPTHPPPTTTVPTPHAPIPVAPPPPPIHNNNLTPAPEKRLRLDEGETDENRLGSLRRRKTKPLSPLVSPAYRSAPRSKLRPARRTPIHTPGAKYTPKLIHTPKTDKNAEGEDLRRCLLTGRDNLKSTPGLKRSPGGTPERSRIPVFSDDPNDLVSIALRQKFYNVRRLYGSPSKDGEDNMDSRESSFNLSID